MVVSCSTAYICGHKLTREQPRFTYTSSKDALKRSLNGIAVDIQANSDDDIEHEEILKKVSRGAR